MLAYPLTWPSDWPRTPEAERKPGLFNTNGRALTLVQARDRVLNELAIMDGRQVHWDRIRDIRITTNVPVRQDGVQIQGRRLPSDNGVALYFTLDGNQRCVPCDRYYRVEQNVAAIAATLSALRALERHGSGVMERAFTGFAALPETVDVPWHDVLGVPADAPWPVVRQVGRQMLSANHPDKGGDAGQFDRVRKAYKAAEAQLA